MTQLYLFIINCRPVRKCHYPKQKTEEEDDAPKPPASQSYLYKATTKSLFFRRIETVFDPATEVAKYTGFAKPLCNLVVREKTHLFVHDECVYDNILQQALPLEKEDEKGAAVTRTTTKGTPARNKAADEDEQYLK